MTRPLARLSVWALLLTILAWYLFATKLQAEGDYLFVAGGVRTALATLALLSVPFALLIAADAVVAWRDPARGRPRRLGLLGVAAAAFVLAWLFFSFDLMSFSTDY